MALGMRHAAGVAGLALALVAAGCHRKPAEKASDAGESNIEAAPPAQAPTPLPPPPPAPAPEPAPKPPSPPKPPPPPPISEDQQMRDDAAASGMTGPIETANDTAAPASADNGAAPQSE